MSEIEKAKPNIVEPEMLADQQREIELLKKKFSRNAEALMELTRVIRQKNDLLAESQAREMRLRTALNQMRGVWESMIPNLDEIFGKNNEAFGKTLIQVERALNQPAPPIVEAWKPGNYESYFYITFFDGESKILGGTNDGKSGNDEGRIEFGNCFKTKEEAERAYYFVKAAIQSLRGKP